MAGFIRSIYRRHEKAYFNLLRLYNAADSYFRGAFYPGTFTPIRMDGKTVMITGCNRGIGLETAKVLYKQGARVLMACNDVGQAEAVVKSIEDEFMGQSNCGKLVIKSLDLSSMVSVRKCAQDILDTEEHLHVLINNGGTMEKRRTLTEEGFEVTFATNHLGHFLLTLMVSPKLIASAPSRVINVSSIAYQGIPRIHWDDLNYERRPYLAFYAYGESKQANVLFTAELARRLKDKKVTTYSLHPGLVVTQMVLDYENQKSSFLPGFIYRALVSLLKTPAQGAVTTLYCVFKDEENDSGRYFNECRPQDDFSTPEMRQRAKELWDNSCKLIKVDMPRYD